MFMKFNLLLEELLFELSGEEIHKKFYGKMSYDEFLKVVMMDPQTKVGESNRIEKLGKYGRLLLSIYSSGGLRMEDSGKAKEYVGYLYQHNLPVDIKKVRTIGDLYNIVKDYIVRDTKDFGEVLKVLDKNEYELLHNGDDWFIFKPLTEKASCYLGVNTQWCTTYGEHSLSKEGRGRTSAFSSYNKPNDPLYIIINKENPDIKYQLHFGTNQYMDPSDKPIKVTQYFKKYEEWVRFFFPSFYSDVSQEQLNLELRRIDVLNDDMAHDLIQKAVVSTDNELIQHIMRKDSDSVVDFMGDDDIKDIDFYSSMIEISVRGLEQDAEQLSYTLSHYEYETHNGNEFIYDDLRNYFDDDDTLKEKLESGYFSKYFNENKDLIQKHTGISNYKIFKKYYLDNYVNNEKIKEALIEDVSDLSSESYESYFVGEVTRIKSFIQFTNNTIDINIPKFIKTLLTHNIRSIDSEGTPLWNSIDLFISDNSLPMEYEGHYNYDMTYPEFGQYNEITKVTENYFEKILYDENNELCRKYRDMLDSVVDKLFKKDNFGHYSYEDENISVMLKSLDVDCSDGTVSVIYQNKQTGKTYGTNNTPDKVKIENLSSLVTNYKLFEQVISFKKNII